MELYWVAVDWLGMGGWRVCRLLGGLALHRDLHGHGISLGGTCSFREVAIIGLVQRNGSIVWGEVRF